jgi:shikimate dehydrogenase
MTKSTNIHFGLIGWPVEHSLSPVIHRAALMAHGLGGEYDLFPIPPLPEGKEGLFEILESIRNGEISGVNVTVPHKQNVIPGLDRLSPAARKIGAVNTIYMEDGKLTGDNTDSNGFLFDLKAKLNMEAKEKTALVLGAGGSSRAVVYALGNDGWQVSVAARRVEQAINLVNDLNQDQELVLNAYPLDVKTLEAIHPNLIVNTTPVGMLPNIFESPWPLGEKFPKDCFVYDLIYNPEETILIKKARQSGQFTSNGLGMLVEQAALAFEKWTGLEAPRHAMYAAVEDKIQPHQSSQEVEK